jgi:Tol biopolymer transport system component
MQIWKMRPDGTEQQQITGDEFNNWFPHIAPDGKSMVVLSFLSDVDPSITRSTSRSTSAR